MGAFYRGGRPVGEIKEQLRRKHRMRGIQESAVLNASRIIRFGETVRFIRHSVSLHQSPPARRTGSKPQISIARATNRQMSSGGMGLRTTSLTIRRRTISVSPGMS